MTRGSARFHDEGRRQGARPYITFGYHRRPSGHATGCLRLTAGRRPTWVCVGLVGPVSLSLARSLALSLSLSLSPVCLCLRLGLCRHGFSPSSSGPKRASSSDFWCQTLPLNPYKTKESVSGPQRTVLPCALPLASTGVGGLLLGLGLGLLGMLVLAFFVPNSPGPPICFGTPEVPTDVPSPTPGALREPKSVDVVEAHLN